MLGELQKPQRCYYASQALHLRKLQAKPRLKRPLPQNTKDDLNSPVATRPIRQHDHPPSVQATIGNFPICKMENLTLQELPPSGGPNHIKPPPPQPGAPPLPPQVGTAAGRSDFTNLGRCSPQQPSYSISPIVCCRLSLAIVRLEVRRIDTFSQRSWSWS